MTSTTTLARGGHAFPEHGVCLLELAALRSGEPHSDRPASVCPVIAAFGRVLNDAISDDAERTELLLGTVSAILGTRSTPAVERRRFCLVLDWVVRQWLPAWLELVADLRGHGDRLRQLSQVSVPSTPATAPSPAQSVLPVAVVGRSAGEAISAAMWAARHALLLGPLGSDAERGAVEVALQECGWRVAGQATFHCGRFEPTTFMEDVCDAAWNALVCCARSVPGDSLGTTDVLEALVPTAKKLQGAARDLMVAMSRVTEASLETPGDDPGWKRKPDRFLNPLYTEVSREATVPSNLHPAGVKELSEPPELEASAVRSTEPESRIVEDS